jgi:hypothetical protein
MSGQKPIFGQVRTITLLCGKLHVRRPSTFALVRSGAFPAELTSMVWKIADGTTKLKEVFSDPENLKQYIESVEKLIPYVLVDLKFGEVTDASVDAEGYTVGTVKSEDMDDMDKQWLFLYAIGFAKADDEEVAAIDLSSFRDGAARGDAGLSGEQVQPAAVEPAGAPPA